MKNKAIFIDRDGVLNFQPEPHDYVKSWREFRWLPGAKEGIKAINDASFLVVVISNQRGVARRLMESKDVEDIHKHMQEELEEIGAKIDGFYVCPHDYSDNCECRKPKPGLFLQARDELNIDLGNSYMIGDNEKDVEAAKNAGCRPIKMESDGSLLEIIRKLLRTSNERESSYY